MYVTTFYSFRGGVGRTMSLVNIAAYLAQSGRRVLVVDFDLEAPGVRTYRSMEPRGGPSDGLVEYVKKYLDTSVVPDVRDFVYQPSLKIARPGALWVMPSGREDALYSTRLSSIDWSYLYGKRDGYLLFEELKAQWKAYLNPDYVLIDSRTGHTEVGGICTRHLADAVVTLFIPTEQNLGGLQKVISDVKAESARKEIKLHYVMSNVPDLDDEHDIVERRLALFRQTLGFKEPASIIHQYQSLQLLEQRIFTIERSNTRLAREYITLADAIIRSNLRDREGALARLSDSHVPLSTSELELIQAEHAKDGDVLYALAKTHVRAGRVEEALVLLNAAEANGCRADDLYVFRAGLNYRGIGKSKEVAADLLQALHVPMSADPLNRTIRMLAEIYPVGLKHLSTSTAFNSLKVSDRVTLASDLASGENTLDVGTALLKQLAADTTDDYPLLQDIRSALSAALIARGEFREAVMILKVAKQEGGRVRVNDTFNLAMASWAVAGEVSKDLFQDALNAASLEPNGLTSFTPNFSQAIAMSHWAIGEQRKASEYLALARKQITENLFPEFSSWRYLKVAPAEFSKDLDAMERMFNGKGVRPPFLSVRKDR
jgi:cellulose biosynthesis protein BcsQ